MASQTLVDAASVPAACSFQNDFFGGSILFWKRDYSTVRARWAKIRIQPRSTPEGPLRAGRGIERKRKVVQRLLFWCFTSALISSSFLWFYLISVTWSSSNIRDLFLKTTALRWLVSFWPGYRAVFLMYLFFYSTVTGDFCHFLTCLLTWSQLNRVGCSLGFFFFCLGCGHVLMDTFCVTGSAVKVKGKPSKKASNTSTLDI